MRWSCGLLAALGWLPQGDGTLLVRVLDESGRPLPAAEPQFVRFAWKECGRLCWRDGVIDPGDAQAFHLPRARSDVDGLLVATSSDERVGLTPVHGEATVLDVCLREPLCFDLELRDDSGATVQRAYPTYVPVFLGVGARDSLGFAFGYRDGVPSWRVPDVPFRFEIDAGPMFPPFTRTFESSAELTSPLVLRLPRHPRIEGVVRSEGEPVPGVDVRLWRAPHPRDPRAELDGGRRPRPTSEFSATTDEAGRFALPVVAAGEYVLRAHSVWYEGQCALPIVMPTGESRVVTLDLEPGIVPLEGLVRLPPGCRETGLEFRGLTSFQVAVHEGGRLRLGCFAGDWEIRLWTERTDGTGHELDGLDFGIVDALHVEPGRPATVDLDFTRPPPCRLSGSLKADGVPLVPRRAGGGDFPVWTRGSAVLERWSSSPSPGVLSEASIADDGTFRMGARAPVEVLLSLEIETDRISWSIVDHLALASGERRWALDVPTGNVLVRLAPCASAPSDLCYRWRGPGELRAFVLHEPISDDRVLFERVPAGEGELVAGPEARVLARTTVYAGGTSEIDLR